MIMFSTMRPIVFDQAGLLGECTIPTDARILALVVHPDASGRCQPGYRFITDVLCANGVATVSFDLRTPDDGAGRAETPVGGAIAARLRDVLAWAGRHNELARLPVGLIAVNDAVAGCVAAGRHPGLDSIRGMVMIDGPTGLTPKGVAAWRWPTLSLLILKAQIKPRACPGAYEAVACKAAAWLNEMVLPASAASESGNDAAKSRRHARLVSAHSSAPRSVGAVA